MMDETMTVGLRDRAVLEHTLAVARIAEREREQHDGDHARLVLRTEELLSSVLGLTMRAPLGYVEVEGLKLGARFHRYAGHTAWRLCLIEACAVCGDELLTPLLAGFVTLGAVLDERAQGTQPKHGPAAECWKRGR